MIPRGALGILGLVPPAASRLTLVVCFHFWTLAPCCSSLAPLLSKAAAAAAAAASSNWATTGSYGIRCHHPTNSRHLDRPGRPNYHNYGPIPRLLSGTRAFSTRDEGLGSGQQRPISYRNVGKEEMMEILEAYEEVGREESQYCVIDVRTPSEVMMTGPLSPHVVTLPLQQILERQNAFTLPHDEFQETFGFAKPNPDEILVFTCAAGVRSVTACRLAAQAGYTKLINYTGGAYEWFQS